MRTKVAIFNDRNIPMRLRAIGRKTDDMFTEVDEQFFLLEPATMKEVEINIPSNALPLVKIWENNTALVSYVFQNMETK